MKIFNELIDPNFLDKPTYIPNPNPTHLTGKVKVGVGFGITLKNTRQMPVTNAGFCFWSWETTDPPSEIENHQRRQTSESSKCRQINLLN